ncbi:MAG: MATE family efflux transporter [Desulfobacteraceae bacterium]|nr:MAG: MATE family efflux transporter [Desulfobacteraceae bacterium]
MGQDPVWRLLLRFSLPAIVSMTAASSYGLIDAIFIGRLGPAALAAMGVTFPLTLSFVAISSGTGVGVTSLIARSLGAGDQESADRTAGASITLCFLLSAVIAAVCLPLLDGIMRALGANDIVLPPARSYAFLLIVFNIFSYLLMILANLIRADGNPVFSSSVSIAAALLNVLLDPIFIFGFGPVPSMGLQGAAVATVLAQAAGSAVNCVYVFSGRTGYTFKAAYFIPRLKILAGIYRVGTASIVRSGAQLVVMGVINNTAAAFGVVPLAILGVLVRVGRFVHMPILGLGQGMLPLIGYNYGAGKKCRISEVLFKGALAGSCWTFGCWLAVMLFPTQIMSVFSGSGEFLREGAWAARLYGMAFFTLVLRTVPGLFFQGIGKGMPAVVLTGAQSIIFLLIPILVLPRFFGLTGLWLAFPVADILGLVFGQLWMNGELRRQGMNLLWWKSRGGDERS